MVDGGEGRGTEKREGQRRDERETWTLIR